MRYTHTTIVGGGQAGLAASRCLTGLGIDHVVLERGVVAQRWRTERWDSLRLLTPNWMSRLPDWNYRGIDPDGFMTAAEVADHLTAYARSFAAPVEVGTAVERVWRRADHYRVTTDRGELVTDNVVISTGACDRPRIPGFARRVHPDLVQLTPAAYRHADDLPPGGVLVVGASASGVQLAAEFRTAGRDVILAVGRHTRLPRAYRGRDIHWWLDRLGVLRRPVGERGEARQDRHHSSAQLTGRAGRDVDLGTLRRAGVTLVGRLVDIDGARARFAGDLPRDAADADDRLARLLSRIDEHIATAERDRAHAPGTRPPRVRPGDPLRELDLAAAGIGTIVWATGYRRSYPWLRVPVLDPDGELVHRGGVTPAPGLYALGLPLQSRVNSTFIDGVGHDAAAIAGHIARRSRHRAA